MIEKLIEELEFTVEHGMFTAVDAGMYASPSDCLTALRELKASADALKDALGGSLRILDEAYRKYETEFDEGDVAAARGYRQALATYQEKFGHDG